ncbi:MAG: two-component system sensor histidine kinase NtrB [Vicinamibacterales bacterium]
MIDSARLANLARVLASRAGMADLLHELHHYAIDAAGGRCSVLLQLSPRTARLHPTSAFGLEILPTSPWLSVEDGLALATGARRADQPIPLLDLPARHALLASHLATKHAIVLPLAGLEGPLGLVIIGVDADPSTQELTHRLMPVADAFVLAIERARLRRDADLQRQLRVLMHGFSQRVSAALSLRAGLEMFGDGAARLLGADRISVWLYDRRARELRLEVPSDSGSSALAPRVPAEDLAHPAALAMWRDRAQIHEESAGAAYGAPDVAVGLQGRRRALGTLLVEGLRIGPGGEAEALARAEEVGRHLSSAIENTQLFEQVLQSRHELENTLNSLADLVAVCDPQLNVVHVNEAFARRAGVPRRVMASRSLRDFVGPAITDWLAAVTVDASAAQGPVTREIADGVLEGTFAITVTPLIGDEGGAGVVVVARDMTRQSRLEAERTRLRDRLTQSEKLAALGQFVAGIAHEMNNPLQGVLGHLELLRTTGELSPRLRRDIRMIYREADRAAKIVRNLLVFAGSRRLSRHRLSLNLVAARVVTMRGASCRAAHIDVVRTFDESLPRLVGDPLMLQQALLNVVLNAEQAVAGLPDARIEVHTSFNPSRRAAVVTVADNGPGVPPDLLPRVFEPFFTTKEVGKGTGLGLAIAYGIIQEHGGTIRVTNRAARGAVFTVDLPVDSVK